MRTSILLGALLLFQWGCMPSLESTEPPERIYWLDTTALDDPVVGARVRVSVVPGLDTDRIWILGPDQRLNYYAGAFWPDNLQPLLESVLDRSLNRASTPAREWTFRITIERFFAVQSAAGELDHVALAARIRTSGSGSPVCLFAERATPATERLREVVAAHQQLLDALTRELNRLAGKAGKKGLEGC